MTSQVHFRMDKKDKENLDIVMQKIGMTPAEAFRIFAKKSIEVGGIPFEVNQPTERLKEAIKSQNFVEFDDPQKGLDWLND